MYRTFPYIVLFVVVALLQVFLLNNLTISVYLNPLVYIAFIILLPIETPPVVVLFCALLTGVTMDWTMGVPGLNTLATLPAAMLRRPILASIAGKEPLREGGVPSVERLGRTVFPRYVIAMVLIQHFLFFAFESLSWAHILHTFLRLVASSAVTIAFVWLLARFFLSKFTMRK